MKHLWVLGVALLVFVALGAAEQVSRDEFDALGKEVQALKGKVVMLDIRVKDLEAWKAKTEAAEGQGAEQAQAKEPDKGVRSYTLTSLPGISAFIGSSDAQKTAWADSVRGGWLEASAEVQEVTGKAPDLTIRAFLYHQEPGLELPYRYSFEVHTADQRALALRPGQAVHFRGRIKSALVYTVHVRAGPSRDAQGPDYRHSMGFVLEDATAGF